MLLGGVYVGDARARLPKGEDVYAWRGLDEIQRIIIHHVGSGVNRDFTAEEIADYHVRTRKWPGIAYHFLAHQDGRLEYVGDVRTVRYHAGRLNGESIGICMAGDFTWMKPPRVQMMRVHQLMLGLFSHLERRVLVCGHRDVWELTGYPFTECPGNTWEDWRDTLAPWMAGMWP